MQVASVLLPIFMSSSTALQPHRSLRLHDLQCFASTPSGTLSCTTFVLGGSREATTGLASPPSRNLWPICSLSSRRSLLLRPTLSGRFRPATSKLAMCSDAGVVVGDIVEFTADDLCTVGIVEKIRDDYVMILPLVRREGMGEECYVDESQPMVTVSSRARATL